MTLDFERKKGEIDTSSSKVLLMVQKSGINSPVEEKVVEIPSFTGF